MRRSWVLIFFMVLLSIRVNAQDSIYYTELLSEYINFKSTEHHEKEAGEYFMQICKKAGLHTQVLSNYPNSIFNFIASIYPLSDGKENFVFLNHIDVVDPGDTSEWKHEAFSGYIGEDFIWGRGAIDNKGMAVAQFAALVRFIQKERVNNIPFNVSILCVSGEETGSYGATEVVSNYLDDLNIKLILGEGGSGVTQILKSDPDKPIFGISTSEKSRLVIDLDLNLKSSGHTSIPPNEYALKEMVEALERLVDKKPRIRFNKVNRRSLWQLGKAEGGIRGFVLKYYWFPFFRPFVVKEIRRDPEVAAFYSNTISISNIAVPNLQDNQLSGAISVTLDCRLLPEISETKFIRRIDRILKDKRIKISIKNFVKSPGRTYNPDYYRILDESIQAIHPQGNNIEIIFPATSDNSIFRSHDIDVFGIFPAVFSREEMESIHNVNERISHKAFHDAIDVYHHFLMGIYKFYKADDNLSFNKD